jgi:hypothetical protein
MIHIELYCIAPGDGLGFDAEILIAQEQHPAREPLGQLHSSLVQQQELTLFYKRCCFEGIVAQDILASVFSWDMGLRFRG